MGSEAGVWETLTSICLAVGICGVVVPSVTGVGAFLGFSGSLFAMLGFGTVGLALSCGLVLVVEGRLGQHGSDADSLVEDAPESASADV